MKYKTLETLVVTNSARTKSVRVSATVSEEGKPATLWTFSKCRFTHFSDDYEACRKVNALIADLLEDDSILDELNEFTDKFN